jgi:YidC/Oxa1 family membrane protein insertase
MTTLDSWAITAGPGLGTVASEQKENQSTTRTIGLTPESAGLKGRIETLKAGVHNGPYRWIGIDNRYFLAALMPSFEHFQPMVSSDPSGITLTSKAISLKPGGTFTWEVPYYLGPKGHSWLSHYGVGLERAIDFGFFSQIGRMMLVALLWLHGHIGNWGWSIIVLTLALQILLMPMTYKSLKAAAAMRKVQPEVTKLQQRYKDDPTRLNTEMMALYKNAGANPLGGCLPMLAQMPIFIALYNALRNSWELHGASWMFWIHDLSAKDPFYILPVVMGGLMFLQSKLNPPAGDPTQQQMMMFMPLIFTFMFLKFPSGLVLYWLTNSLVSTIMQLALRNHLDATA